MSRSVSSARKRGATAARALGMLSPRRGRPSAAPARRGGAGRSGTVRLLLVFFGLIGVNVYFLGLRGGTSIGELLRTTRVHAGAPAPAADPSAKKPVVKPIAVAEDLAGSRVAETVLGDGQTIAQALASSVGKKLATTAEQTFSAAVDLGSVHAGQTLEVVFDADDRPTAVEFRVSPMLAHRVDLTGKHAPTQIEGRMEVRIAELVLPCGPTLWDAIKRGGEAASLGELLARVLGGEGELTSGGAGERLRVVVEKQMVAGHFHRYGRVLGAEWITRAGIRRSFVYGTGDTAYFNERGEASARRYLATPIRASRGVVPGRSAPRAASDGRVNIDYSGPNNTTVQAVAAGVITAMTRGPAGSNMTLLVAGTSEHVQYARVSRLARGLKMGSSVAQGATLGRADAGVTLTYEGIGAAAQLGRAPSPRGAALALAERPHFGETIAPILERLRMLALRSSSVAAGRTTPTSVAAVEVSRPDANAGADALAVRAVSAIP